MKFSDIQKYRTGSYEVDVSFEHLVQHLNNMSVDYGLELCPDFQRGVVWDELRQVKFVEHILKGGTNAKVIYFNSPVWAGFTESECDLEETIVCVDGLQRLTSVMKFLNNEIKAFDYYYNEFEGRIPFYMGLKFNINNIQTRKELLEWYLELNEGLMVHEKSELERVRELLEKEKNK